MSYEPYKEDLHPLFEKNINIEKATLNIPNKGTYIINLYSYKSIYENDEVTNFIDSFNKIFISSDYHISRTWRLKQGIPDKIKNEHNSIVDDDDLIIILGDLTDPEYPMDPLEFIEYFKSFSGHKILILGNNDTFDNNIYYQAGFEYVLPSLKYKDIIFTHLPYQTNMMNIHGHIHNSIHYYNVQLTNHKNIYIDSNNYKPYTLNQAKKLMTYGRTIWSKERIKH